MRKLLVILLALTIVSGAFGLAIGSEKGKLTIWTDQVRGPIIRQAAKEFEDKYDIPITVQEMAFGDVRDKLSVAGPAGKGPDILIGAHDWLGQLVSNGLVKPLQFMEKRKSEFTDISIRAFSYAGDIYGLPYATEAIALIYNKDLVPEPPQTWDELLKIAERLTNPKKRSIWLLGPCTSTRRLPQFSLPQRLRRLRIREKPRWYTRTL